MGLEVQRPTFAVPLVPDVASVRGAPSHLGGIAPVVGSMQGHRLEAPPPSDARAQEQQNANMMSADARVEPPASEYASAFPEDAHHHRSLSEVGANGPAPDAPHASVSHNTHTPNTSPQLNLRPGNGPINAEALPVPSGIFSLEAFPSPIGIRGKPSSEASGMSELKMRDMIRQRPREQELAQLRYAAAVAEARTLAAIDALRFKQRPLSVSRWRPGEQRSHRAAASQFRRGWQYACAPSARQCARYPLSSTCTDNSADREAPRCRQHRRQHCDWHRSRKSSPSSWMPNLIVARRPSSELRRPRA